MTEEPANTGTRMSRTRIVILLLAAVVLAAVAAALVPQAIDAARLLAVRHDPVALAERKVALTLDRATAVREIEAALAADDPELAQSFVDLAADHHVAIDPELAKRVAAARAAAAAPSRKAANFAKGFVTGEPRDAAGFAGTALGDLFVFGDIRDAVREGARLVEGKPADRLVLGLACVGLAVTAGTYATLGASTPVRVGLTLAKAARKSGRLGTRLGLWLGRSLRGAVHWSRFRQAIAGASIAEPAVAVRAAREAVKLERAGRIVDLVRDVGRVQRTAGTRTALDALKLARGPKDMAKIAKLAAKKGSRTRAILKLLGAGAILFLTGTMQVTSWLLWAVLALFGFVASSKGAAERITRRWLQRRRQRILAAREQEMRDKRLTAMALRS